MARIVGHNSSESTAGSMELHRYSAALSREIDLM
jgi:hypothetical protein